MSDTTDALPDAPPRRRPRLIYIWLALHGCLVVSLCFVFTRWDAWVDAGWLPFCVLRHGPPDGGRFLAEDESGLLVCDASPLDWREIASHSLNWALREPLMPAFSPNGEEVVVRLGNEKPRVVLARTGRTRVELEAEGLSVSAAAFSPDGRRVAGGCDDGRVRVWDAETGGEIAALDGPGEGNRAVSFSPDGNLVASVDRKGVARVWDVRAAKLVRALGGKQDEVWPAVFLPDGRRLLTNCAKGTVLWDITSGEALYTLPGQHCSQTTPLSPDGARVLTVGTDGRARTWDALTGKELVALGPGDESVYWASFAPDGRRVVTSRFGTRACVWDARTGRRLCTVGAAGNGLAASWFQSGGDALVVGCGSMIHVWHRRRPEWWWGHLYRPEVWAAAAICAAWAWLLVTLVRTQRRRLRGEASADSP